MLKALLRYAGELFLCQLNDGGVPFVSENGLLLGEGSDKLKYILAALVVPKS